MWNEAQDYARYTECVECGRDTFGHYLCRECRGIEEDES